VPSCYKLRKLYSIPAISYIFISTCAGPHATWHPPTPQCWERLMTEEVVGWPVRRKSFDEIVAHLYTLSGSLLGNYLFPKSHPLFLSLIFLCLKCMAFVLSTVMWTKCKGFSLGNSGWLAGMIHYAWLLVRWKIVFKVSNLCLQKHIRKGCTGLRHFEYWSKVNTFVGRVYLVFLTVPQARVWLLSVQIIHIAKNKAGITNTP
jgi:hypothetical protein